jgi:GrpB-like predicted nucleotidyltransferase (UPF0157 family)
METVSMADYDPQWPKLFESLRERIAAALGPLALTIEHVGSTSVPDMCAKPIIDLDVLLSASHSAPKPAPPLYYRRGPIA